MNKYMITLLFVFTGFQFSFAQVVEIDNLLFELPDVIFTQIESAEGYEASYELKIKQPLDHFDASKGFFYQNFIIFLLHI